MLFVTISVTERAGFYQPDPGLSRVWQNKSPMLAKVSLTSAARLPDQIWSLGALPLLVCDDLPVGGEIFVATAKVNYMLIEIDVKVRKWRVLLFSENVTP